MAKSEVYSWRLSADLKAKLEDEARREGASVGALLERISEEWLESRRNATTDREDQVRLHRDTEPYIGAIDRGDPFASQNVRARVRARIRKQHGR